MRNHLISLILFIPLLGILGQTLVNRQRGRWIALFASLTASLASIGLVLLLSSSGSEGEISEAFQWIGSYAITYDMSVDGLNAILVLLIAILFPVLIASEWNQKLGVQGMHSLFLALQTSLFGIVCAQDLFLQFFFWGLSALPFYFLVGIWGGENREKAAFSSIVSSTLGNALIFSAGIIIYYSVDPHTFSLRELAKMHLIEKQISVLGYGMSVSSVAAVLMSLGLSLRAPVWPLHGWFTDVARESPLSVFVALSAGVMPVALYVFARTFYLLFPETLAHSASWIVMIGGLNLIIGGICAVSQKDLRRLMAFICISELGLTLMGIGSLSSAGVVGSIYHHLMLGLALAGFGLFTNVISERIGHTEFEENSNVNSLGGIVEQAPVISVVAAIVVASLLGFPGFGGFVGHTLMMIGSYSFSPVTVMLTVVALLLAAYYLFSMYRRIFLGKSDSNSSQFQDLTLREKLYMSPLVGALLLFGLYPKPLIDLIRPTVLKMLIGIK